MEHDEELTEPDSNIRFIVPDSQFSDDGSQDLDLLPALKPQLLFTDETVLQAADCISSNATMSERKTKPCFHFSSTTESEVDEQAIPLAVETANDTSDSSRSETDRNVTVVERVNTPKQSDGKPLISTPAKKIRSLQFSGEHTRILVPETLDSYDEVAATPDAFESVPMIIPDSPCMDDKEEENEESGEITFRAAIPTIDQDYPLTIQTSSGQESQSFHLKLTPSQSDVLDTSDAEEITMETAITEKTSKIKPVLQVRAQHGPVSEGSKLLPSLSLHAPNEMENIEGSEESLSVFRRVKSSSTTPQKHKFILDDSDEFLPAAELASIKRKRELGSPSKQLEQLPATSVARPLSSTKGQEQFTGKQDDLSNIERNKCPKGSVDISSSFNAQLGLNVSEDASSKHIDVDLTLSYDYTNADMSLSVSRDQSADVGNTHIASQVFAADSHSAHKYKGADSPEGREHFNGAAKQITVSTKETRINTALEQQHAQSTALSQGSCSKVRYSHSEAVLPSTPKTSNRNLNSENCGCKTPDLCPHRGDRRDEQSSKVGAGKDLNDNTSVARTSGNDVVSTVAGRREEAAAVAREVHATSFSNVAGASDISTLRQSKSADPYTFSGSQPQTAEGTSYLEVTEQSHLPAPRASKRFKIMRKVLKKRIPPKVDADKSSTDEINDPEQNRKLSESRVQNVRVRKKKSEKTVQRQDEEKQQNLVIPEQRQEHDNQQQLLSKAVSEPTQFTSLQKKIQFNKPFDPDIRKTGPSTQRNDSSTRETQQLINEGQTKSGESTKQSKKTTTSTEVPAELSDSSEHEVERSTVQRIDTVICIGSEKTVTEVYNSKGTFIRRTENTVELEKKVFTKVTSETVSERVIIPQLSPSRSAGTMTTGDLADISSSSLSRMCSSGSKSSIPSFDVVHSYQSLPTPAQRQQSLEKQDSGRLHQEDACRPDSDLPGANAAAVLMAVDNTKRHSSNSSTGKDLFSTPDQSIIDRADSELGKVVSSSNSTPCSQSLVSPSTAIRKPEHDGRAKATTPSNTRSLGVLAHDASTSTRSPVDNDGRSSVSTSMHDQPIGVGDTEGASVVQGRNISVEKVVYIHRHRETPGRQNVRNIKRTIEADSHVDEQSVEKSKSSEFVNKKQKMSDAKTSDTTPQQQKTKASGKTLAETAREDLAESTDIQSTGFSVHGGPPSASGGSLKDPALTVSSKSSAGFSCSPEISLQGGLKGAGAHKVDLKEYKSKAVQGAKVMGKWKDGYYYPGILSKVDHNSKKYMVKFDDGSQRIVKMNEIILAAELPVGQSVMVMTSNGFYESGMVMGHSEGQTDNGAANLVYHVERDDGITQMCERKSLILSDGQAACLFSDEEMRISPDVCTPSTRKPGDISLDNLVEGKRHLKSKSAKTVSDKEDQPSVSGVQSASAAAPASALEGESCQSGRKRKEGPVATSTPTPKQICKESKRKGTPVKKSVHGSLGCVVASPHDSKKVQRKVRAGPLFEPASPKKSRLFEGMSFILTHVEKSQEDRKQEKLLLEDSSLETSTDNNTDIECETSPFVKEQLQHIIESNGGEVIHSINDAMRSKHCYLVAAEYQRTVKYLQALAAGMTIVSHQWILHSVAQNKLQGPKAYILPSGISLEKRKLMERVRVCSDLANQTVMVVSDNKEFVEAWTSILKLAQSHIVSRFPTRASKNDPGVDVVVSDSSCPSTVVRRCQQLEVPLVSSEWVAQCLITGHLVDVKGHDKYKHDFSS
ncbi:hypothetical protein BsWGS_00571 [Bradybaena similaris]